jgi:uncharacterized protein YybS (DUF2232 family)
MSRSSTLTIRGLTESAILAALVALFALAARYMPLVGAASVFICPIPLTIAVVRHGFRAGILSALVAGLIAAMIGGPLTGVAIALTFAPMGIALGAGVRANLPAGRILLLASAVACLSLLANLAITLAVSGVNPYTLTFEGLQQGQDAALDLYSRLGVNRGQIEQQLGPYRQFLTLLPRLIPLLVIVGAAGTAYVSFEVTRFVLRRFGYAIAALPPISAWRVPVLLVWLLPLSFVLQLWAQGNPAPLLLPRETLRNLPPDDVAAILRGSSTRFPWMETAGLNITILAQMVFSLMGLVAAWVLLGRYRTPPLLRWLIILMAFSNPVLGAAVFFLGLADAVFDLRGRWRRAAGRVAEAPS